jgi:hypothetical protein
MALIGLYTLLCLTLTLSIPNCPSLIQLPDADHPKSVLCNLKQAFRMEKFYVRADPADRQVNTVSTLSRRTKHLVVRSRRSQDASTTNIRNFQRSSSISPTRAQR